MPISSGANRLVNSKVMNLANIGSVANPIVELPCGIVSMAGDLPLHREIKMHLSLSAYKSVGALVAILVAWAAAAADVQHGRGLFAACAFCHTEKQNAVGPSLKGVVGRKSAALSDFLYSRSMRQANLVWNEDNLREYITDPQVKIKGNRRHYDPLPSATDVDATVAYL